MAGWAGSLAGNGGDQVRVSPSRSPSTLHCGLLPRSRPGQIQRPSAPWLIVGNPPTRRTGRGRTDTSARVPCSVTAAVPATSSPGLPEWELVFLPPKTHALPFNVLALPYPLPHCNLSSSDLPSDLSDLQCILSFNEPESVRSSSSRAFLDSRSSFHSLPTRLQRFSLSGDDTTTSRTPRTATVYHRTVPNTFSPRKTLAQFCSSSGIKDR